MSRAIKNSSNNKISVSTGFLRYDSIDEYHSILPANTFDFYDYHMYSSNIQNVTKMLSGYLPYAFGNKKMILGEMGYKDDIEPDKKDPGKEMEFLKAVFEQAYNHGISPCLLWDLDFYELDNREKLIDLLKNYKDK